MHAARRLSLILVPCLLAAAGAWALQEGSTPPTREELLAQAQPGPEHEDLARFAGDWDVVMRFVGATAEGTEGTGTATTILGGRFLVVDFALGKDGAAGAYRYTIGFDRRHGEYSIVVMDTSGTYFVTARGPEKDGVARLSGTDDDPMMASMGFTKKFVYDLELRGPDAFQVKLYFVDTRTPEEKLLPFAEYVFERSAG